MRGHVPATERLPYGNLSIAGTRPLVCGGRLWVAAPRLRSGRYNSRKRESYRIHSEDYFTADVAVF